MGREAVIDDAIFDALDALLDDGFCLCRVVADAEGRPADYLFLRVNHQFEAMTGLSGAEGRTALELVPDLERSWIETYGRVGLGREATRFSQGSMAMGRVFDVYAVPVAPAPCFAVLFRDVTDLRRMEEERGAALEEAQALLRELNHRVMNSFAAISAITAMEMRAAEEAARPALQRLQGRVQALGALYRRLDGAGRVDRIDVGEYLSGNVAAFRASAAADGRASIAIMAETLVLPTRAAVPLGLVLNELLSNAMGHGPQAVRVTLAREGARGSLLVEDDGPGAEAEAPLGTGLCTGLGRGLVQAFVGELGGEVAARADGSGTCVAVTFPIP